MYFESASGFDEFVVVKRACEYFKQRLELLKTDIQRKYLAEEDPTNEFVIEIIDEDHTIGEPLAYESPGELGAEYEDMRDSLQIETVVGQKGVQLGEGEVVAADARADRVVFRVHPEQREVALCHALERLVPAVELHERGRDAVGVGDAGDRFLDPLRNVAFLECQALDRVVWCGNKRVE